MAVTLLVAVPLLVTGLILGSRGSRRGRLLWLAMLFSVMYSYLFYDVGAAFNVFFPAYVAIVGLALSIAMPVPKGMQRNRHEVNRQVAICG